MPAPGQVPHGAAAAAEADDEVLESHPLLAASNAAQQQQQQQQPALKVKEQPPSSPSKATQPKAAAAQEQPRTKSAELGQCRICLEEDALPHLETPCGCTGTQRHAHKACIQRWVNEKHHTTCEICDQPYKGDYVVPPAPPPSAGEQLTLVSPIGNLYLTVEDERLAGQLLTDVYDEFDDHRQPTVSWCFSFMMFLLFMMFLQSAMPVNGPADGGPSGGQAPPSGPSGGSADPSGGAAGSLPGLVDGMALFLVWLLSKLLLAVFPVLMVMRLAARAHEEAAAGGVPGLDGPPHTGGSGRAVTDGSGREHHPLAGMLARLAAARAASAAAAAGGSPRAAAAAAAAPGGGGSSGSTMVDLEMEVLQARRQALHRLGRDPTFWGSPAAAAAAAPPPQLPQSAGPAPPAEAQQAATAPAPAAGDGPPEQRVAMLRALMRAIRAAAVRRQGYEQPGQQQAQDGETNSSNSTSRVQGGVV